MSLSFMGAVALKVHVEPRTSDGPGPTAPIDPAPLGSRTLREARRLCGGASMLSPFVALLALGVSFSQLGEVRKSARLRPISEIVGQSAQITMWMASYPEVAAFFQADLFLGDRHTDEREALDALAHTDTATRRRVQVVCEVMADFFETTYTDREAFDPDEWDSWWSYMADVYAESPVLRVYLARRGRWYTVDEPLGRSLHARPRA